MITVTQDLRDEHKTLQKIMGILEKLISLDKYTELDLKQTQNEIIYFLRVFVDKCHHGKEEVILFPAMIKIVTPPVKTAICVMLDEHAKGRELVNSMDCAAKSGDTSRFNLAAAAYIEFLGPHIEKENYMLFELAEKLIPDAKREYILKQYDEYEENVIGSGIHEKLHELIEKWDEQIVLDEEDLPA